MEMSSIDSTSPLLSVVIPAYNEELRIRPALHDILDFCSGQSFTYEVIVVDDGSRDRTADIVREMNLPGIRVYSLVTNAGKGAAVRCGVLQAKGERILYCDADGATPFREVLRLLAAVDHGADVAIGSRALLAKDTSVSTVWYRKVMGRTFNGLVNFLILPGIADTQCGFKLFTRKAAQDVFSRQRSQGFSFDVELLFLARKSGYQIAEIPVNWTNIPGSKVDLLRDSLRMLRDVFWFRWLYLRGDYRVISSDKSGQ